jgi:hypothetical protein
MLPPASVRLVERQVWRVKADPSQSLGRDVTRHGCKEIGKSHGGTVSNEEDRHSRHEESIRGIIEDLEKIKTTGECVHRRLHCRTQR